MLSLLPVAALVGGVSGVLAPPWLAFGASASTALVLWFGAIAREFRLAPWYALTFPLGALVYFYIAIAAVTRGTRVRWKGREYDVGA